LGRFHALLDRSQGEPGLERGRKYRGKAPVVFGVD
jgi:hypothetical protein